MSQLEYRKKYKLITTFKYIHLQSLRLRIIKKIIKDIIYPFSLNLERGTIMKET